jgi:hypothetical protein
MRRVDAIGAMVFAGYHGDSATWTRLMVEERVSAKAAREAWRRGVSARGSGVGCGCSECAEAKVEENGT